MTDKESNCSSSCSHSRTTTVTTTSSSADNESCDTTDDNEIYPSKRCKGSVTGSGKFKSSWKLPPYIACSRKGIRFASCKLCHSDFSVSHGCTRHVNGSSHSQKFKEKGQTSSITTLSIVQHLRLTQCRL